MIGPLLALALAPSAVLPAATGVPAPAPAATVEGLVTGLRQQASVLGPSDWIKDDLCRLADGYNIPVTDALLADYLRVTLVFEAVREAGWWHVAWSITNREPRSDAIWGSWARVGSPLPRVTVTAECDESSALAAFLMRRLGIRGVGLLWPYPNHTVPVWKLTDRGGNEVRIVLPTSQIFLEPMDGLGTRAFKTWYQRAVHDYSREDVSGATVLPADLVAFFLRQAARYAGASDRTQNALRVLRARFMGGESAATLAPDLAALAASLRAASARAADLVALDAFTAESREFRSLE